jgi:hypothetical protein
MADYHATTRSNYFRVKDATAFKQWCDNLNLEVWPHTMTNHPSDTFYAISADTGDCSGWPTFRWDDEIQEHLEIDLAAELADWLDSRDVAILLEAGAEALRYVNGFATAVHPNGRTHSLSLDDIYHRAADAFGDHMLITQAAY